jgi:hypothetical protein
MKGNLKNNMKTSNVDYPDRIEDQIRSIKRQLKVHAKSIYKISKISLLPAR